jgi:hypothetical protein
MKKSHQAFNLSFKEADVPLSADDFDSDDYVIMAHPLTEHLYSSGLLKRQKSNRLQPSRQTNFKSVVRIYTTLLGGIYQISMEGFQPQSPETMIEKPVRTTAKQAELIVALLKGIGLTDDDLVGSVSQLRAKANNKVNGLPFPDDDKPLIEWLRRGGISR